MVVSEDEVLVDRTIHFDLLLRLEPHVFIYASQVLKGVHTNNAICGSTVQDGFAQKWVSSMDAIDLFSVLGFCRFILMAFLFCLFVIAEVDLTLLNRSKVEGCCTPPSSARREIRRRLLIPLIMDLVLPLSHVELHFGGSTVLQHLT